MGRVQLGVGRGLRLLRVRSSRADRARGSWGACCAVCSGMSCAERGSRRRGECGGPGEGSETEEGAGRHGQLLTLLRAVRSRSDSGDVWASPPIRELRTFRAFISTLVYTTLGYFYNIVHAHYPLYAFCISWDRSGRPRGVTQRRSVVCRK